jgi:hypothetical protein
LQGLVLLKEGVGGLLLLGEGVSEVVALAAEAVDFGVEDGED